VRAEDLMKGRGGKKGGERGRGKAEIARSAYLLRTKTSSMSDLADHKRKGKKKRGGRKKQKDKGNDAQKTSRSYLGVHKKKEKKKEGERGKEGVRGKREADC